MAERVARHGADSPWRSAGGRWLTVRLPWRKGAPVLPVGRAGIWTQEQSCMAALLRGACGPREQGENAAEPVPAGADSAGPLPGSRCVHWTSGRGGAVSPPVQGASGRTA